MNLLLHIIVHTCNVLGSFNDPFEFDGDYGPEINPIRQKVFEAVIAKEALAMDHRQFLCQYGPTLSELVSYDLISLLTAKQQQLQDDGFRASDLAAMIDFLNRYGDQKVFHFFRSSPAELLSFDKILRNQAAREGKNFDLPILSSTQPLEGSDAEALKANLLHALFNKGNLTAAKPETVVIESLNALEGDFLKRYFGDGADNQDLLAFCTPAGQLFFYWLYQTLNLHLVSDMIEQINEVKSTFAQTIGDTAVRAQSFKEKLLAAHSKVVFTQECDALTAQALTADGTFLPVDKQNPLDGTFVFLSSDKWNSDYSVMPVEGYDGYPKGRLNVVLATSKQSDEKFLLASAHGNSINPADGRRQISLIMDLFLRLSQCPENPGLQLLIGIDANTKTEEDVERLHDHLDSLGLVGTHVGPTTVKKRMVTVQHSKAGRLAVDEEDFLITLKPETGGRFLLNEPRVGFGSGQIDINIPLPNIQNPSDHYPVGAEWKNPQYTEY